MNMKKITKAKEQASALIITLLAVFLIAVSIGIAMTMTTATVAADGFQPRFLGIA